MVGVGDRDLGVFPLVDSLGAIAPHRGQVARPDEALTDEPDVFLVVDYVIHAVAVDVCDLDVDRVSGVHEPSALRIVVRDEHVLPVREVALPVVVQRRDVVPHDADSHYVVVAIAVQIAHCEMGRVALYRVLGDVRCTHGWH